MENSEAYNGLTMKGRIRPKPNSCPKCQKKFQKTDLGFVCPDCLTTPRRLFIDLHVGERIRIFKDDSGQSLDSFDRADRLLSHIRWEIDNLKFNPEKYQRKNEPYMMANYASRWLKEQRIRCRGNEISPSTLYKWKMYFDKYIIPYFGMEDVRTIGTRGVKDFNLHLTETKVKGGDLMSPKYRDSILGTLRQMFYDGLRSADLNRINIPVFPTVDVPDAYFDFLTEEEQEDILTKIPIYDYPIFHTIMWYGIRPSEVRALMRDCIVGDFNQIVIRRTFTRNKILRDNPKENKWRMISLQDETKDILRRLPVSITGFIFVNKWGRRYSQSYLNDTWNQACKDAKYRYIPLKNASRHSLGTKLAQEGLSAHIIAEVLGHSDTKTTKKYVRYASDSLKPFFKRRGIKKGIVTKLSPQGERAKEK